MALPITAASANSPTAATCSAVEMPKPTAIGNWVKWRRRSTRRRASEARSLLGAGYADARDGIDESAGDIGDHFQAVIAAGRRGQKNRHQPVVVQLSQIFFRLFDDHVGDQHAVHTAMGGLVTKALQPQTQDWDCNRRRSPGRPKGRRARSSAARASTSGGECLAPAHARWPAG